MVSMRMRGNHKINLFGFQRIAHIRTERVAAFVRPAVDNQRFSVADDDRRISLPDIDIIHGKIFFRRAADIGKPDGYIAVGNLNKPIRKKSSRRKKHQREQKTEYAVQDVFLFPLFLFLSHFSFSSPVIFTA